MKSCTKKSLGVCAGKFSPVTHVIFDLDGTILDSETIYFETYREIVAEYGKEYDDRMNERNMGAPSILACERIINELKIPISLDDLIDKYHLLVREKLAHCGFMPGAVRLIKHLKESNVPFALATSSAEPAYTIKTTPHEELFKLFHHVVVFGREQNNIKKGKPAPDIFLLCASRFDEKPLTNDILVFEDSPNGVQGALAAGMQVVMTPSPTVDKKLTQDATLVLDSLEKFKPEWFGLPPFKK